MRCPPSTCSRDPIRQRVGEWISWARAEEEFQVFDTATRWGPSIDRSRSDRISHVLGYGPVGDHRPPPVWFPGEGWILLKIPRCDKNGVGKMK